MTTEEQVNRLIAAIEAFVRCLSSLPAELFLAEIDEWAPRDVLAHLIGWNRYTISGCEQVRNGEIPFYLTDPGEDFGKVNAVLVREISSRDRGELLEELAASCQELGQYLRSPDPAEWERDYGVKDQGYVITVQNSVDGLIEDYLHHRQQIEEWAERAHHT